MMEITCCKVFEEKIDFVSIDIINSSRLFSLECCQSVTNLTVVIMNSIHSVLLLCKHEKTTMVV